MPTALSSAQSIARKVSRTLRGESLQLVDRDSVSTTVPDAVVIIAPVSVGTRGSGPGEWSATLRLAASWHATVLTSLQAVFRGHTWQIAAAGDVVQGAFRIELNRHEEQHTNLTDLDDGPAEFLT